MRRRFAFPLVQKLLAFNTPDQKRVAVIILSRNDPVSGLRVFRSAEASGLQLDRGVFTRGRPPYHYLKPLGAHLFLPANEVDARAALDGDAVLFSDESERIFKAQGLTAFNIHEQERVNDPLLPGPFKPLLAALHRLQMGASATGMRSLCRCASRLTRPWYRRLASADFCAGLVGNYSKRRDGAGRGLTPPALHLANPGAGPAP